MRVIFDPILGRIRADFPTTSVTPPGGGTAVGVIGSGTVNIVTKFSAASTIADSQIFDDGTNVGVNITTSLGAKFHIKGSGATSATYALKVQDSGSNINLCVRDDGNVGIGNNNPDQILNLYRNNPGGDIVCIRYQNSATGMNGLQGFETGIDPNGIAYVYNMSNFAMYFGVNNANSMHIFPTTNNVSVINKLNVGSDGEPVATLDVRGAGVLSQLYNTTNSGNSDHYSAANTSGSVIKYMITRFNANGGTNGLFTFLPNGGTAMLGISDAKLGFFSIAAAPIVQPTTGIAAATFVANTSLIANDSATFDGYTIGQVVKSLRNLGFLA